MGVLEFWSCGKAKDCHGHECNGKIRHGKECYGEKCGGAGMFGLREEV